MQKYAVTRAIIYFICFTQGFANSVELAEFFNRDHSSILNGVTNFKKWMENKDDYFMRKWESVERNIYTFLLPSYQIINNVHKSKVHQ